MVIFSPPFCFRGRRDCIGDKIIHTGLGTEWTDSAALADMTDSTFKALGRRVRTMLLTFYRGYCALGTGREVLSVPVNYLGI